MLEVAAYITVLPGQIIIGPAMGERTGLSKTSTCMLAMVLQKPNGLVVVAVTVYVPGVFQMPEIEVPFEKVVGLKPDVGLIVQLALPLAIKVKGLPTQYFGNPAILNDGTTSTFKLALPEQPVCGFL